MTTDDTLDRIRATDPYADRTPDPDTAARIDATVDRLLADEPATATATAAATATAPAARRAARRPRARTAAASVTPRATRLPRALAAIAPPIAPRASRLPRARTAAALTGAVVACGLGLAVALPGTDGGPGVQAASAATVLADARAAAISNPGAGPWTTMTTKSWTNRPFPLPGGGTGVAVIPTTSEAWASDDGTELRRSTRGSDVAFPRAGDRAAYEALPAEPAPVNDGKLVRQDTADGGEQTVADVRALPTDPDALEAKLAADGVHGAGVVHEAAILLLTPLPTPRLRAALFTVLQRLPGTSLERGVRDPEGRTGDGVHVVSGDDDTLLLFDADTHELLGVRTINDQQAALGRTLTGWDLVLDTHRTSAAPAADIEERFPTGSHGRVAPRYVPAG